MRTSPALTTAQPFSLQAQIVISIGAATNFFGVPGAEAHSRAIYTMEDAISVRNERAAALEHASAHGPSVGELNVAIVGGGPTGVEMAGTLAELTAMELDTTYRELDKDAARIMLLEQRDRLLGGFDPRLGAYAELVLAKRGVALQQLARAHDDSQHVIEIVRDTACQKPDDLHFL